VSRVDSVIPFLCQMSGVPGSGKSTVAAHLVRWWGAVSIDHDTLKSALVSVGLSHRAVDPWQDPENLQDSAGSGNAAYSCAMRLTESMLGQGLPVVHDSPCFYHKVMDLGLDVADRAAVPYVLIECRAGLDVVDARLRGREPRPTQCGSLASVDGTASGVELFEHWARGMVQPPERVPHLLLDTENEGWPLALNAWLANRLARTS
jgi:predicted kinase